MINHNYGTKSAKNTAKLHRSLIVGFSMILIFTVFCILANYKIIHSNDTAYTTRYPKQKRKGKD